MATLVVGSVAFDNVKTPFGTADNVLGGSATYFSVAASFFSPVNLVAVVGEDFSKQHERIFHKHQVDLRGLQRKPGKSFFWWGEYSDNMNDCRTLDTQLNVFADFSPRIPREYQSSEFVFLGNIHPRLQREVLKQVQRPRLIAMDTMNYWINNTPGELRKTLKLVDMLIINDNETRMITGEHNLVRAAERVLSMGPKTLVVKRGEHGVTLFRKGSIFAAPAFPLKRVFDPTGAGDSFAGGFVGYLASCRSLNEASIRRAVVYGSVMASFKVEDFSLKRLTRLRRPEIEGRFKAFQKLMHFDAAHGIGR
ncbi:MAG: PfkB family carbohydrate kinase [Terriglobia bacterium]